MKNQYLKNKKGITLIALVITIIVLIILAGVSISLVLGENGIVSKSSGAKENTEIAKIIENARLDILGQFTENKGENITKLQLKTILNIYFVDIDNLEIPDDLSNSNIKLKARETYGGYDNIALRDIYNGKFIEEVIDDNPINIPAKDVLIANPEGATPQDKSPYVNYTDENGNTILCRVLYNDEEGIDIITADVIKIKEGNTEKPVLVPLGYDDPNVEATDYTYSSSISDTAKKAAGSYNRAFTTLNEISESYRNKTNGIAESSRCVGSPRGTTVNTEDPTTLYSLGMKIYDENFSADFDKMGMLGIRTVESAYWLASRFESNPKTSVVDYSIRAVDSVEASDPIAIRLFAQNGQNYEGETASLGIRPVFHLSSGVMVVGGVGSEGDPYVLDL